ncbi:MAG: alanine racemase, partial [Actinomycetota bacterium]
MSGRRWAHAIIDLDAIAHNVRTISAIGDRDVWVVVKADAYGHGAVPVARAALAAGATGCCVALVQEGLELRAAGIDAPILLFSEQPHDQLAEAVAASLTPTVYSQATIDALAEIRRSLGGAPIDVHVKVDTGMQRVGAHVDDAPRLLRAVLDAPDVRLAGVFTHLAVA